MRAQLHSELPVAIRGLEVELRMNASRISTLSAQLAESQGRLNNIAAVRAEYNNLAAEVQQQNEIWNKAQGELADARASQAAAHSASLVTRLDGPQVGAYPEGPSRAAICLAGVFGGLMLGLSVVVLTSKPVPAESQAEQHAPVRQAPARRPAFTLPTGNLSLKDALLRVAFGDAAAATR